MVTNGSSAIEHRLSGGTGFVIAVILWAPFWWYDTEIRCALGSEKACVSLHAPSVTTKPITDRLPQ